MTETKRTRLQDIQFYLDQYEDDYFLPNRFEDVKWLIEQAERAQALVNAHELKDKEHNGLVQQLKEKDRENKRLREANGRMLAPYIENFIEHCKMMDREVPHWRIILELPLSQLRQAL